MVPDVNVACERFEKLGVDFVKRPNDGRMKGLAFIKDPDGKYEKKKLMKKTPCIAKSSVSIFCFFLCAGYWIEIFNPNPMFPDTVR